MKIKDIPVTISRRQKSIPIPENCWGMFEFEEGEEKELICQNLTSEELYNLRESVSKNSLLNNLAELLAQSSEGGDIQAKIKALKQAVGIASDSVPDEYVRHIESILLGVLPKMSRDQVLKLGEANGVYFLELAMTVMKLSGEGGIIEGN